MIYIKLTFIFKDNANFAKKTLTLLTTKGIRDNKSMHGFSQGKIFKESENEFLSKKKFNFNREVLKKTSQ